MTITEIKSSAAYQRRNSEWPSEGWDYTEWEECAEEAKAENVHATEINYSQPLRPLGNLTS